jgi:hypothetical protein
VKPLIDTAVFGLVPIPPTPNTHTIRDKRDVVAAEEDVELRADAAERLADPTDELARLRRGLGLNTGQAEGSEVES